MTTALNTRLESLLLEDIPPITVDWSTTIQSLSTDLQGYDASLELTATDEMLKKFLKGTISELKAEKPLSGMEYFFCTSRMNRFANGANIVEGILSGQTILDKAADLVRGLEGRHKQNADYLKKAETQIYHDRTILKNGFSIRDTRHSFSVGKVHQLAQSLKD